MIVYRIQHKKTGLFSRGGTSVSSNGRYGWNKSGKIWDTLGKLRSHITSHLPSSYRPGTDMSDWQVISYELVVHKVQEVHEIVTPEKIIKVLASGTR